MHLHMHVAPASMQPSILKGWLSRVSSLYSFWLKSWARAVLQESIFQLIDGTNGGQRSRAPTWAGSYKHIHIHVYIGANSHLHTIRI